MINVLLTSSNLYYPFLKITLTSLVINNKEEEFDIYILSDGISDENKKNILEMENSNVSINFIEISDITEQIELTPVQRKYLLNSPLPITSRLFVTKLLPSNVDKVISLDSDVLIVNSVRPLWQTDISDYYYAGVKDLMPKAFTESIGLTEKDNYLNTGVILVNLRKLREDEVDKKYLTYIENNSKLYMHYDQGIINAVCKEAMLAIHPKFNYIGSLHVENPYTMVKWYVNPSEYYDEKTIEEAKKDTVIYHFCEGSLGRPWTNKNHYYYSLYNEYVNKTGIDESLVYDFSNNKPFISKLFLFLQTNTLTNSLLNILPSYFTTKITNQLIKGRIKSGD